MNHTNPNSSSPTNQSQNEYNPTYTSLPNQNIQTKYVSSSFHSSQQQPNKMVHDITNQSNIGLHYGDLSLHSNSGTDQVENSNIIARPAISRSYNSDIINPTVSLQAREILSEWLDSHAEYVQPPEKIAKQLAFSTGLSVHQVTNWISNERARRWKESHHSRDILVNQHDYFNHDSSDEEDTSHIDFTHVVNQYVESNSDFNDASFDGEVDEHEWQSVVGEANFQQQLKSIKFSNSMNRGMIIRTLINVSGNLPKNAVECLKQWLFDHFQHPYPTDDEKAELASQTRLNLTQVNNWFINARRRIWRPIIKRQQSQLGNEIVVTTSASGAAAIQKLQQHQPNLVQATATPFMSSTSASFLKSSTVSETDDSMATQSHTLQSTVTGDPGAYRSGLRDDINSLLTENRAVQHEIEERVQEFNETFSILCERGDYLMKKLERLERENEVIKETNKELSGIMMSTKDSSLRPRRTNLYYSIEDLGFERENSSSPERSAFRKPRTTAWPPVIPNFVVGFFAGTTNDVFQEPLIKTSFVPSPLIEETKAKKKRTAEGEISAKKKRKGKDMQEADKTKKPAKRRKTKL